MRNQRKDLVRHAPPLPDALPDRIKGKPKVVDLVEPHASALYNEDPEFRAMIGSLSAEESKNGAIKYDQVIATQMVASRAEKNKDKSLGGYKLAKVGTAVTSWARRYGIARSQRIEKARDNLLTARAAPAE